MNRRIALITTPFLRKYYKGVFDRLAPEMHITIIEYHNYRSLPDIYRGVANHYDGFLVSGRMVAAAIEKGEKRVDKPFVCIEGGIEATNALLLEFIYGRPTADMKRVVLDAFLPVDSMQESCAGMWRPEKQREIDIKMQKHIQDMSARQMAMFESQVLEKADALWKEGKIDFVISMLSSIMEQLKERGIPCAFAYPQVSQVQDRLDMLCGMIDIASMRGGLPAAVNIVNDNLLSPEIRDMNIDLVVMQKCLLDVKNDTMTEFILQQTYSGFQIIADLDTVEKLTQKGERCLLRERLEQQFSTAIYIGYGIGKTLQQARSNADRALLQSRQSAGSYLLDDEQRLTGPLGQSGVLQIRADSSPKAEAAAAKAGLSILNISRVYAICDAMQSRELTTLDLSQRLRMTTRNAYRILKAMEKAGLASVVGRQSNNVRGRPILIYRIAEMDMSVL